MYWTFHDVEWYNKQRQELHELLWRSVSVPLQSNNDQLFVFSFPCGEAYMAFRVSVHAWRGSTVRSIVFHLFSSSCNSNLKDWVFALNVVLSYRKKKRFHQWWLRQKPQFQNCQLKLVGLIQKYWTRCFVGSHVELTPKLKVWKY